MSTVVPVPGGAIAVDEHGASGPPVVLVHGGTSTAAVDWTPLLPLLTPDFRVITFDHRGHGRSRGFAEGIGMDRFGMDLLHVLRYVGVPRAALVGFSIGANTLLRLVPRRPDIGRALVVIGGAVRGRPERVPRITSGPWLDALIGLSHVDGPDGEHWKRIRDALAADWGTNHHLTPEQAARITCPTLVLHGEHDRVEPADQAEGLAAAVPDAELLVIPGAGHMAQVDRPDIVGPAIAGFLRRVHGIDRAAAVAA